MKADRVHKLFVVSVVLKGLHSMLECIGGAVLVFVSTDAIKNLVARISQESPIANKSDVIARHLASAAEHFSPDTKHFYSFYLLSHGLVKLGLVAGLLKGKLWAYPASLAVMGLFIAYQVYRYVLDHSVGLIVLTVFDVIVIALIWHEYRVVKRSRRKKKA
jgi:uncharacterized membrane protein